MFKRLICLILVLSHIFMIVGCTKSVKRYRWVNKPYTAYDSVPYTVKKKVPYQGSKDVPNYVTIDPVFPSTHDGPLLLAVLPFTSSTGNEYDGIEIAEEIEYEMQKHPRAESTYKIFNRTQLGAIFTEHELSRGISPSQKSIFQTKKLLGVEGLITGHVKEKSQNEVSFILKAINTDDATTCFTQRFEGDYDESIYDVVDVFYESRIRDGYKSIPATLYKTIDTTEYRVEEVTKTKKVKQSYTAEEFDESWLWGILGVIILIAISPGSDDSD